MFKLWRNTVTLIRPAGGLAAVYLGCYFEVTVCQCCHINITWLVLIFFNCTWFPSTKSFRSVRGFSRCLWERNFHNLAGHTSFSFMTVYMIGSGDFCFASTVNIVVLSMGPFSASLYHATELRPIDFITVFNTILMSKHKLCKIQFWKKWFANEFPYKHSTFWLLSLLIKIASKTVIRSIDSNPICSMKWLFPWGETTFWWFLSLSAL